MKIGVHLPYSLPFSIKNYFWNMKNNLVCRNINLQVFSDEKEMKKLLLGTNIFWFPYCAGGSVPPKNLMNILNEMQVHVIVTLHGAAPFSLKPTEYYSSIGSALKGEIKKWLNYLFWQTYKKTVRAFITVSHYAKQELNKKLKISEEKIYVIYHGVDFATFNDEGSAYGDGSYLLHVSQYQPKKNAWRIIQAYQKLPKPKPKLLLISPGFKNQIKDENVILIRKPKTAKELAVLYKNAIAFIFPSLHETFGMPIVEAMACGCPVITSNATACREIAGDAALLVNPYSIESIVDAMRKVIYNKKLRNQLARRGLKRAKEFSWEKSAMEHLRVFKEVINGGS